MGASKLLQRSSSLDDPSFLNVVAVGLDKLLYYCLGGVSRADDLHSHLSTRLTTTRGWCLARDSVFDDDDYTALTLGLLVITKACQAHQVFALSPSSSG
jgi:hypothetical protein